MGCDTQDAFPISTAPERTLFTQLALATCIAGPPEFSMTTPEKTFAVAACSRPDRLGLDRYPLGRIQYLERVEYVAFESA